LLSNRKPDINIIIFTRYENHLNSNFIISILYISKFSSKCYPCKRKYG